MRRTTITCDLCGASDADDSILFTKEVHAAARGKIGFYVRVSAFGPDGQNYDLCSACANDGMEAVAAVTPGKQI